MQAHFHAPDPQLSPRARSWDGPLPSPHCSGLTPCPPSRSPGATPVRLRGSPRLARSLGAPLVLLASRAALQSLPTPILREPRFPLFPDLPVTPFVRDPPNPASPFPWTGSYPFPCLVPRTSRPQASPEPHSPLGAPSPLRPAVPHFRHPLSATLMIPSEVSGLPQPPPRHSGTSPAILSRTSVLSRSSLKRSYFSLNFLSDFIEKN